MRFLCDPKWTTPIPVRCDRRTKARRVLNRRVLNRRASARIFRKVGAAKPHRRNKDLKWKKSYSHDLRIKFIESIQSPRCDLIERAKLNLLDSVVALSGF